MTGRGTHREKAQKSKVSKINLWNYLEGDYKLHSKSICISPGRKGRFTIVFLFWCPLNFGSWKNNSKFLPNAFSKMGVGRKMSENEKSINYSNPCGSFWTKPLGFGTQSPPKIHINILAIFPYGYFLGFIVITTQSLFSVLNVLNHAAFRKIYTVFLRSF
jgi:hypothetical protein